MFWVKNCMHGMHITHIKAWQCIMHGYEHLSVTGPACRVRWPICYRIPQILFSAICTILFKHLGDPLGEIEILLDCSFAILLRSICHSEWWIHTAGHFHLIFSIQLKRHNELDNFCQLHACTLASILQQVMQFSMVIILLSNNHYTCAIHYC